MNPSLWSTLTLLLHCTAFWQPFDAIAKAQQSNTKAATLLKVIVKEDMAGFCMEERS